MLYWSDNTTWDNGFVIQLMDGVAVGVAVAGDGIGTPSLSDNINAINVLQGMGPTEKTISATLAITSSDISGFEADFGATAIFQFNVTIPGPANVVLNQDAILNSLNVQGGALLQATAGNTLTLNHSSVNSGELDLVGATVNVQSLFTNTGTIQMASGSLGGPGTTINLGSFEWTGGTVSGGLTNASNAFTIIGTGGWCAMNSGSVLTNGGTVTQVSGAWVFASNGGAIVNNLAGACWNLQGDGGSIGGDIVFNNAGTFRKSSGGGTTGLFYNYWGSKYGFNNTGTVEVDSGTLAIGNGSNNGGSFVLANATLQLGVGETGTVFTLHGTTSISGSGVVDIPSGAVVRATNGETATYESSSSGVSMVVSGGNLYADTGSTLLLNCTGTNYLNLAGGAIGGAGTTTNIGNFQWSRGKITGSGGLTNASSSFTVTGVGGTIDGGSVLTNSGTITQTANSTVIGYMGSATVNNLSGSVWNLQGDNGIVVGDIIFNNVGLFRKSTGNGTADLFWNYYGSQYGFNNTGTVEVDSGTLAIGNGSNSGGSIVVTNGATLQLGVAEGAGTPSGGVFTLHGTPYDQLAPGW